MTGGQIVLLVLASIVAFFILILSIPVHVSFSYEEQLHLSVRYLFLKFKILPLGEKKEKKPKKPKKEKAKKPAPEKKEEAQPKAKKKNPLLDMVKANGYDGMMEILSNLGQIFKKYGKNLLRSMVFEELDCYLVIGKGDAAKTAIEYGKACQKVYPLFGYLCSNHIVRKYDVSVEPDFLANRSKGELFIDFHLTIRKIINATVAMVVRLLFKVALKFLRGAKKKTPAQPEQATEPAVSAAQ